MASSLSIFLPCFFLLSVASATDADFLLTLKSSADPRNTSLLHWPGAGDDFCRWQGVRECLKGRVSKLILEHINLTGKLDGKSLSGLDQLRVLSFKGNRLSSEIPDFSGLPNLKSLYLNGNDFTGRFPASLAGLHRLKTIVFSDNRLTGEIPPEIATLSRLYTLYLDGNDFSGPVPPLNQPSLRFLNLSGNRLSGRIPETEALKRFNSSSFSDNPDLCGVAILTPCIPPPATSVTAVPGGEHKRKKRTIIIAAASAGAAVALVILVAILLVIGAAQRRRKKVTEREREDKKGEEIGASPACIGGGGVTERGEGSGYGGGGMKGGFSWEGEGLGKLVFVGPESALEEVRYSLEELLKASAETLGRGTVGSSYKAVMESGYIVTVKRLKEARYPRLEDFRRQMEVVGRMRHPNLVAVRAFFQAKEERLLVYDYFPNGSLFSLIHGSRPSGGGKPLHWTSCLKIAEDLATGLLYIHQNFETAHGNLKSSNVLLGSDFESCLTDYCLQSLKNPETVNQEPSAASLFYKAPETRTDPTRRPAMTPQSDVYSFGVILLELLTGKTPFQDLVQEHGADIPKWVKSVREEETESGDDPSSGNETSEEKLGALLSIAMACVALDPESRPQMREVLRMVREARSEAHMSSNSSDHSPGRWSDTVLSLPREEHQSM